MCARAKTTAGNGFLPMMKAKWSLIQARAPMQRPIINAGAYSHTSVAILDALQAVEVPIIEVHLSNIFAREEFRHHSYVSGVAAGVICGLGAQGYEMAIDALAARLA